MSFRPASFRSGPETGGRSGCASSRRSGRGRLPLGFDGPVGDWSIRVHASGTAAQPRVTLGDTPMAITADGEGWGGSVSGKGKPLSGTLAIAPGRAADLVASTHHNGERDLELGGDLLASAGDAAPSHLRIYWDRSRSRLKADTAREIALVRAAIDRWHPARVELVAFNSSGAQTKAVATAEEAAAWLGGLDYRGATSFAPLSQGGCRPLPGLYRRSRDHRPRCRDHPALPVGCGQQRGW